MKGTGTMTIPVIKAGDPSMEIIKAPAYIIARDGFYLKKSTSLFDAVIRVDSLPGYEDVEETASLKVPMIPWSIIHDLHEFFQAVYYEYRGEAIALLTLDDGVWGTHIPEQTVSSAHLDYKITGDDSPKNVAGTVHSHCDMGAFFSGTDEQDQSEMDGLHIVLGRITMTVPEIKAAVCVNGRIFEIDPEDLIDGIPGENSYNSTHPWLKKVSRSRRSAKSGHSCRSFGNAEKEEEMYGPMLYPFPYGEEDEEGMLWNAF